VGGDRTVGSIRSTSKRIRSKKKSLSFYEISDLENLGGQAPKSRHSAENASARNWKPSCTLFTVIPLAP